MLKTLRNSKALTLIELIAVLVILGIIAAIAIPTIGNTIDAQRQRAAEAEWASIISAARLYIAQNASETEVSMDDLFDGDYISENVALTDGDEEAITSSTAIFDVNNGEPEVKAAYSEILIDGFSVYSAPA